MSRVPVVDWKGLGSVTLWEAGVYQDGQGLVRVPYRLPGGALHREQVYGSNGRIWWDSGAGLGLVPFGLERIPSDTEQRWGHGLLIAEGVPDALAVRDSLAEWRGKRLDVIGLPGAGTWRHEWKHFVVGYSRLYIVPDADQAGRAMLARTWVDVPGVRWVRLPEGEDSRSVIQGEGIEAFCEALAEADYTACQSVASRFARDPEDWVRHMLAMHEEGLWA